MQRIYVVAEGNLPRLLYRLEDQNEISMSLSGYVEDNQISELQRRECSCSELGRSHGQRMQMMGAEAEAEETCK